MNPVQRWLLAISSLATAATGLVYWWMDTMLPPVDEFAVINHPLQPWLLKAHIVVAPVMVFAVGLIAVDHIWKHYRSLRRTGRRSGVLTMWVFGPMVATGYLIQVVTDQGWLVALGWAHLVAGVGFLVGFGAHRLVLRGQRRADLAIRRSALGPDSPALHSTVRHQAADFGGASTRSGRA